MNEWVEKSVPSGENCNLTKKEKYFFCCKKNNVRIDRAVILNHISLREMFSNGLSPVRTSFS